MLSFLQTVRIWSLKTGQCTAVVAPLPSAPQAIFMLSEQLVLVQCKKVVLLWNQTVPQRTYICKREITGSAVLGNELFVSEQGLWKLLCICMTRQAV